MTFTFRIPAGPGNLFAPSAAESMIGQTFTAKVEQDAVGTGIVLAALVVDDGHALNLTVEWPKEAP
jgi:hypothetical protein